MTSCRSFGREMVAAFLCLIPFAEQAVCGSIVVTDQTPSIPTITITEFPKKKKIKKRNTIHFTSKCYVANISPINWIEFINIEDTERHWRIHNLLFLSLYHFVFYILLFTATHTIQMMYVCSTSEQRCIQIRQAVCTCIEDICSLRVHIFKLRCAPVYRSAFAIVVLYLFSLCFMWIGVQSK